MLIEECFTVLLSNAKSGQTSAVLWHCTQEKDRADIASALILTALGVDDTMIRCDYSLTTYAYKNEIAQMTEVAKS